VINVEEPAVINVAELGQRAYGRRVDRVAGGRQQR
jgi:hypothetical protein